MESIAMRTKIAYESKMRKKKTENLLKVRKQFPDLSMEEIICKTLNRYFKPEMYPQAAIKDLVSLYYFLWDSYKAKGEQIYLLTKEAEMSFSYLHSAVICYAQAYDEFLSGIIPLNPAINNHFQDIEFHEKYLYCAIAVNEPEIAKKHSLICPVINAVLTEKYDKAQELLENLEEIADESQEPFYIHIPFLKEIYLAILDKNEERFNELLAKRINKYRKRPAAYQPYIDAASIALIKMARKFGLQYKFSVEEIPEYFLDVETLPKREYCKIMDLNDCESAFKEWGDTIPDIEEIKDKLFR